MRFRRLRLASRALVAAAPAAVACYSASIRSDAAAQDVHNGRALCRKWDEEEAHPNFKGKPHILLDTCVTWAPRELRPPRAALPGLQKLATEQCRSSGSEGTSSSACREAIFSLAVALLGSRTFGFMTDDEAQEHRERPEQRREFRRQGATLMRRLAELEAPEGLCGWAFCLLSQEPIDDVRPDAHAAVCTHLQAVERGRSGRYPAAHRPLPYSLPA